MRTIVNFENILTRDNIRKYPIQFVAILSIAVFIFFICVFRKSITVVVDGKQIIFITFQTTVGDALKKKHISIDAKDKISKNLNSKIVDNDVITIRRAVNLKVAVDGKELNIKSAEETIGSMLNSEKIALTPEDKLIPSKESKLSEGIKVVITRIETKVITESAPINFKTVVKNDSSMLTSESKVLNQGQNGEKQITTSVVYENGKEICRKIIKETVTKAPIDKVMAQGTLSTISLSRGSTSVPSGQSIKVKATAYWAVYGVGSTYTSSGRKAVRDPNGYSTIAVDPRVIPLGTKVYIDGYGYAVAADEGTAIKGNFVDVFFDTYKEACNWGVKYVNAYIVE
jgi:uncharacterized protein YabE (DUF348 family)